MFYISITVNVDKIIEAIATLILVVNQIRFTYKMQNAPIHPTKDHD